MFVHFIVVLSAWLTTLSPAMHMSKHGRLHGVLTVLAHNYVQVSMFGHAVTADGTKQLLHLIQPTMPQHSVDD